MTLTVYHLKTCDTCRKAIKGLSEAGHEMTLVDVRADGMPADVLSDMVALHGWETVLNRRSTTWRGLDDAVKDSVNADVAVALMGEHPTLIKRPVIVSPKKSTVGWAKAQQAEWL